MSRETIEAAIPHRSPMLLLDEIVAQDASSITCRKTFHEDEFFFQGHYPGQPITPGVILCEASMQAGAVLLSQHIDQGGGVPVATRMNDVRFRRMVQPGDTVELHVQLVERLADAFFMKAKVTSGGATVMRFEFACTVADPDSQR